MTPMTISNVMKLVQPPVPAARRPPRNPNEAQQIAQNDASPDANTNNVGPLKRWMSGIDPLNSHPCVNSGTTIHPEKVPVTPPISTPTIRVWCFDIVALRASFAGKNNVPKADRRRPTCHRSVPPKPTP